jgi:hypothetical protein
LAEVLNEESGSTAQRHLDQVIGVQRMSRYENEAALPYAKV